MLASDADGAQLSTNDSRGFIGQVSTNLADWNTLAGPLVITNGGILLVDPQATNFNHRFYRVVEEQP